MTDTQQRYEGEHAVEQENVIASESPVSSEPDGGPGWHGGAPDVPRFVSIDLAEVLEAHVRAAAEGRVELRRIPAVVTFVPAVEPR